MSFTSNFAYQGGAQAYAKVGIESQVLGATPHQLIVMLFDGVQQSLRAARLHMVEGNIVEKGRAISRALDIVNQGLAAALDYEKGGQVAENLGHLYDYVSRLLLMSNLQNDIRSLDTAAGLLEDIGTAWRELGRAHMEE
jgi:flagellar protein FliS